MGVCRSGSQEPEQGLEQVLDVERSVSNTKKIEEFIMLKHSQFRYIKYMRPLIEHMSGTVQNDAYVMVHSSWLLVPLLAWSILSSKNFLKLFVRLPTPEETTFRRQLPVLDIHIIRQAFRNIIDNNICSINPDHDIQYSQHLGSLYFSEALQNTILDILSNRFQEAYFNLTTWWNAKFQLERMQFTITHYPAQIRRMSNSHTELYQAAPYLQQGRVCNIVPNHSQFYSDLSSYQSGTVNGTQHTPSMVNHYSSFAIAQPVSQPHFARAVVDEDIAVASKLDCKHLYKSMERKANIILKSTKMIENTEVVLDEHKNKPFKKKKN